MVLHAFVASLEANRKMGYHETDKVVEEEVVGGEEVIL